MSFAERLWNTSPGSLCRGLKRRWKERNNESSWIKIHNGYLKDVELLVPPHGILWQQIVAGDYDQFLYEALLPLKDVKDAVVWDIGAHVGYHSLAFAALGAEVTAFEPNGTNFERLKLNVARNTHLAPRIKTRQVALSDTDGEMTFRQSDDLRGASTGSHLVSATPPLPDSDYKKFRSTTVPVARIDTLVRAQGNKAPDILKIDVEGAEELVLRGGSSVIPEYRPILLIEIHHICLMYSVQELLLSWGYKLKLLDKENACPSRCFVLANVPT